MPSSVDGVRLPRLANEGEQPTPHPSAAPARDPDRFERVLRRLAGAIDRGESAVSGMASGHLATMDAGTLIALQAGIYRYSEAIDLTVKLVERATSAAKTVLEGGR
jgi:hypothetical protein